MRRLTTLLAVASTIALVGLAAAPANALYVRPSTAELQDATGTTNGCVANIPEFTVDLLGGLGTPGGDPATHMFVHLNCPAAADVHRVSFRYGVFRVRTDGTLKTIQPMGPAGVYKYDQALDGNAQMLDFGIFCTPQYPLNSGKRTWLIRTVIHTRHSNADPSPFITRVDRRQKVDCPGDLGQTG